MPGLISSPFRFDFFHNSGDMKNALSYSDARLKIERYCAYRDRCELEVELKLKSFGLNSEEITNLMKELIELDFLNEHRFVVAYVSGKFRIKNWGRHKIEQKLREKSISNELISLGLDTIDEEEYLNTLNKLIRSRWKDSFAEDYAAKARVARFAYSKGFETDLIWKVIDTWSVSGKE